MIVRKRFYREVSISESGLDPAKYQVLLDGRPVRSPKGADLILPTKPLADAIADEWRAQGEHIRPESMMLTKLANTAIDRAAPDRDSAIAQILAFVKSDLVCYRAPGPETLRTRQAAAWDPIVAWARERYGSELQLTSEMRHIEQPPQALQTLRRAIARHNDFVLAGLHAAATLTGSAIMALALLEGRIDASQAFAAAHIDESYQAERWGQDHEADNRLRSKAGELMRIAGYLRLVMAAHLA